MDIIIDGYNLIGSDDGLTRCPRAQTQLADAKARRVSTPKGFNMVLVFRWLAVRVRLRKLKERREGITVVYSRIGEKADSVIIRLAREKGSGCVVVTSDREVRKAVESFGAVAIYSSEFNQILRSLDDADR